MGGGVQRPKKKAYLKSTSNFGPFDKFHFFPRKYFLMWVGGWVNLHPGGGAGLPDGMSHRGVRPPPPPLPKVSLSQGLPKTRLVAVWGPTMYMQFILENVTNSA